MTVTLVSSRKFERALSGQEAIGPEAGVSRSRWHVGGLEDSCLRGAIEGWGILPGTPHCCPQEVQELLCLADGVKFQVNDDIVGVIDWPQDTVGSDTGFLAGLREAVGSVGWDVRRSRISVALAGIWRQPVIVIDPEIESHYGTGYERSRLFPGGRPSLEFVRSMELLDRLLPPPPAQLLDVGGGPGTYAAPLARCGYLVHLVDPVELHVEQARQAAGGDPAATFTAVVGDARGLSEPDQSQDAVLLFGPLYHLTDGAHRRQALSEARRVLRPGGRLLAMAVCRFASLLDGLFRGWLDDPQFRPIVDQDLVDGQHRNPDPVGRPEFFTTAYFHTPDGLKQEIEQAGFSSTTVYGVEGPGWPLRQEWADPRRHEQILFAARAVETEPSLIGFSAHLIAAATRQ